MSEAQNISSNNLSVIRGDRPVFEDLNFYVRRGQLLKLIGPNGSGKSTLLKTIAGLIDPEKGEINSGENLITGDHDWIARNICYLGHKNALKKEFTVLENIEFWANLWGMPDKIKPSIIQMGIEFLMDTPVRYLSSGQTRRTAVARSLCHPGSIWLLDEPTVGLDDQGLSYLSGSMKNHLDIGGIIICATHVDLGIDESMIKILDLADFTSTSSLHMEGW
ncbi:MAG: heme ABC exporter ATP-binding protein CcmA [Kordiimonadaceae bacterium]|nr:heme ABC exporter ATP-binding protein CcmA [Kordiimonadaceae bacterium]MBT6032908.1 heme ABC exporter ATP-binding protein CcmA [Kordiimonadaceae bacterium]